MTAPDLELSDAECDAIIAQVALTGHGDARALVRHAFRAGAAARAVPRVRWTPLTAILPVAEYDRIQAHPLFKIGDCIQVWVNEGDIYRAGERVDAAPERAAGEDGPRQAYGATATWTRPDGQSETVVASPAPVAPGVYLSPEVAKMADACPPAPIVQEPSEPVTFDALVEFGRATSANIVNGMPWSFTFQGRPVTHENDDCYIIGSERFERGDLWYEGRAWPQPEPDALVERPWRRLLYRVADNHGMVGRDHQTIIDAADRIEALQQRVRELEQVRRDFRDEYNRAEAELAQARKVIAAADVLIRKWDEQNYSLAGCDDLVTTLSGELALYYRAARAQVGQGEGKK